jgi:hypothetical protein
MTDILALQAPILVTITYPYNALNIRDYTNRCYYYSTDFNSTLYGIQLCKLDRDASTQKEIDLTRPIWYADLTEELEAND